MKSGVTKTVAISLLVFALLMIVAIIVWVSGWSYWSYPIILMVISLSLFILSKSITHIGILYGAIQRALVTAEFIEVIKKLWINHSQRKIYARQLMEVNKLLKNTDINMANRKTFLFVKKKSTVEMDYLHKDAVLLSSGADFQYWDISGNLYVEFVAAVDQPTTEKLRNLVAIYRKYNKSKPFVAIIVCANLVEILQENENQLDAIAKIYQQAIADSQTALNEILPLHIIITNIEVIEGTREFFRVLNIKDTGGPFGYCVDGQGQFASLPEFVDAAYVSIYRNLNLLRLTLPPGDDGFEQSLIHFTPEKIKSSKSRVSRFLESMLPAAATDSVTQIGSLYFTADFAIGQSTQNLSSQKNIVKKMVSESPRRAFFSNELFSNIFPGLDYLKSISLPKTGWIDKFVRIRKILILSLFSLVFSFITLAMYQNMQDLAHLRSLDTFYVQNDITNAEPYASLNKYGVDIETFDKNKSARWIGDIGFTQTDIMLEKMKQRYNREFEQKILKDSDDYLDQTLDLIAEVPEARLVFQHVNFLHNRIGLLQSDWMSLSSTSPVTAVTGLDYRLTIPDINNTSSIILAEFMSNNYLKYLRWQTDVNEIERMQGRDQMRLRELVMRKKIGTAWLSESLRDETDISEYSLRGLTIGFAEIDDKNNVALDLAYTKHGRDALLAIMGDMESAQRELSNSEETTEAPNITSASTIVTENSDLLASYLDEYNGEYTKAWAEYLSFFTYGFRSTGSLNNVEFIKVMESGNSPYDRLFIRAFRELTPIRDSMILNGESVPTWLQNVLNVAQAIKNTKSLTVKTSLAMLPSVLDQAETIVKKIGGLSNSVSLYSEDKLSKKRNVIYQEYSNLLADILEKTHRPKASYELLQAYLDNAKKSKNEKTDEIHKLLVTLQNFDEGENGNLLVADDILRAQLLDVIHIVFIQATKYIQSSWTQLYEDQYERHFDPLKLMGQFTQNNKFLSFSRENLGGLLSRNRVGKFASEPVFGEIINFSPQYLRLLHIADGISTLTTPVAKVSIEAIPTGINSGSEIVPTQTRLTINCGKQEFLLINKNYRVEEAMMINPLECVEVTIEVLVGSLTLTKRYQGEWSYFEFRKDFAFGERNIPAQELNVSDGRLQDYNITQISVGYRISESLTFETLAMLHEVSFPEYIINTTNPIVQR